jgi:3-oxoacyl-[acyl-carrier protein] reductase
MKCALVTGGSRGIGRAICYKMADLGYYVIVNYKSNIDEANGTLRSILEKGGNGELLQFDVSQKGPDPKQSW